MFIVDFFSPNDLATSVAEVIQNKQLQANDAARDSILKSYSLDHCIPQQLNLIELVSSRTFS